MTESTPNDNEHPLSGLRLLGPDTGDDEVDGEPLTQEMLDSLERLRRRLQDFLFAPGFSGRPNWSSIAPGN